MARRDKRGRDAAILVAIAADFAADYFHVRSDTRAFQALVQAGGEPRFVAVEWMRCREFPGQTPRREKLNRFRGSAMPPAVEHRHRFEILDRRDGYALGSVDGEACWLPEWALSGNEPRWLPCDRRGADYYTPYPPGWVEPPPAFGGPGRSCCCDTEGRAQGNAR